MHRGISWSPHLTQKEDPHLSHLYSVNFSSPQISHLDKAFTSIISHKKDEIKNERVLGYFIDCYECQC